MSYNSGSNRVRNLKSYSMNWTPLCPITITNPLNLKCPYDQIFDYFFHFYTQQVFPGHLAKLQSITKYRTHVYFFTFISVNLRPPLIFFVLILGWKLEKMTAYSQKDRTDWNYNKNKCGKLNENRGPKFLLFFVRIAVLIVIIIYYIKVSGIASGNKLIKTIRYPHMWRYDILTCEDIDEFSDIGFVS